jgi:hypothetical protein
MQVNTEKTELALKAASSEIQLFVTSAEEEVKALEEKLASVVPDATTKSGYADCKKIRSELVPIKSGLEGARKTLKAPILSAGKLIDGAMNPLASRIEALYKPFENAYREVDNEKKRKEEERQQKVRLAFDRLTDFILTASGATSTVIETLIDDLADFDLDPKVFMERADEAAAKHGEVMEKLGSMLLQAKQQEEFAAKQAEIEAREQAVREAEQKAYNERIAKQAEKARIETERLNEQVRVEREKELQDAREQAQKQAEIEAEKRHKEEMAQAEQRAKEQAEQAAIAERKRMEFEQEQERVAAERREADRKHKATIHNAVLVEILKAGITEEQAKAVIKLVANRKAASMYIQY